jgi:hypothetical protein
MEWHQQIGVHKSGYDRAQWDEVHMDCTSSEFESPVLRQIYAPDDE